uniref:ATP-dependent DNA helicase n=1 Tax=Strongyloides stercoralis TaxID=6248 RepID=A0A0K0EMX0_STRER
MPTLREMFNSIKPKPRKKLGKFNFVEFPLEYRMPMLHELFGNISLLSTQDTGKNIEYSSTPPLERDSEERKLCDSEIQIVHVNRQKDTSILNYEDENYDDFYDDGWLNETSICDTSLNVTNPSELNENNNLNDTLEASKDNLNDDNDNNNNIGENILNHGDEVKDSQESNIHTQTDIFLKSNRNEFDSNKNLLPNDKVEKIYKILNDVFGYQSFRHEQEEAITATLLGYDIFLLMPTGSGKSLCYQLPSIIENGITVVISSSKILIENEISNLNQLNVPVYNFVSDSNTNEFNKIYNELLSKNKSINLLYVTPEIISGSEKFQKFLINIHKNGMLSRFVIKEAHCITEFSNVFRSDFLGLCYLKRNFKNPKIPIMALSEVSTPTTIRKVKNLLSIKCSKIFTSTFERANLRYDVIRRTTKSLDALLKKIKQLYPTQSGIFYCYSKKECESLHENLKNYDISSVVCHSGMNDKARLEGQNKWMANEVQVICKPMSSSVNINKSDIRFIVHFYMPMSIENYYQESFCAGKDGAPSYCIILYSYSDSLKHRHIIDNYSLSSKGTDERRIIQQTKVSQMLSYCESISECRKKLILEYFGEKYDSNECLKDSRTTCNNCELSKNPIPLYKMYDLTIEAENILKTTLEVSLTMKQMVDCYRGRLNKKKNNNELLQSTAIFGRGSLLSEDDVSRFIVKLITNGYLKENIKIIGDDNFTNITGYLSLTSSGEEFLSSKVKPRILFYISIKKNSRKEYRNIALIPHKVKG